MTTAAKKQTTSPADSFFGMALSQAFLGVAFGAGVDMAFEACEMASAVYTDKCAAKDAKPSPVFDMGKEKSLMGFFGSCATPANNDFPPMPSYGYDRKAKGPKLSMAA